ncbi:glycosyltransferase [Nocardia pseudobrasiliensis]|uniref:glycosyltransferase n=1 Tax=Nocardia pseudobrasiliensis TaxID=45979 RepID=UPI0014713DEF|nr:glycosyltransferase [Nocardia pseudobrasiliensis]
MSTVDVVLPPAVVHADPVAPEGNTPATLDDHVKVLGADPFGVRKAPQPPEFLAGYDFSALSAPQRSEFFARLDLTRPVPTAERLRPAALAQRAAKVSGSGAAHEIPHLVHSIWFGGPLYDDGGPREKFKKNLAAGRQANPDFEFQLWTDVSRAEVAEVQAARRSKQELAGRRQQVADMLSWADKEKIRLINVDEVFSAAAPMRLAPHVLTERARGTGTGYASASDIARVEILHRFGGAYTDGDNLVKPKVVVTVDRIAGSRDGFALSVERLGMLNNSVIVSAANTKATDVYLRILEGNFTKSFGRIRFENVTRRDMRDWEKPENQNVVRMANEVEFDPRLETIERTGPTSGNFDELARRLGRDGAEPRRQLETVPHDVVQVDSAQSWLKPPAQSQASPEEVAAALRSAVVNLHREFANREGVVFLPAAAQVIDKLPETERIAVWNDALRFFRETLPKGVVPERVSAIGVPLPKETVANLTRIFEGTGNFYFTPERSVSTVVRFDEGAKEPVRTKEIAESATKIVKAAVQRHAAGLPQLPKVVIIGYGNGSLLPPGGREESARQTAQLRAEKTRELLIKEIGQQLQGVDEATSSAIKKFYDDPRGIEIRAEGRTSEVPKEARRSARIEVELDPPGGRANPPAVHADPSDSEPKPADPVRCKRAVDACPPGGEESRPPTEESAPKPEPERVPSRVGQQLQAQREARIAEEFQRLAGQHGLRVVARNGSVVSPRDIHVRFEGYMKLSPQTKAKFTNNLRTAGKAAGGAAAAAGVALWAKGMYDTFSSDDAASWDKAAAITAIVPFVGCAVRATADSDRSSTGQNALELTKCLAMDALALSPLWPAVVVYAVVDFFVNQWKQAQIPSLADFEQARKSAWEKYVKESGGLEGRLQAAYVAITQQYEAEKAIVLHNAAVQTVDQELKFRAEQGSPGRPNGEADEQDTTDPQTVLRRTDRKIQAKLAELQQKLSGDAVLKAMREEAGVFTDKFIAESVDIDRWKSERWLFGTSKQERQNQLNRIAARLRGSAAGLVQVSESDRWLLESNIQAAFRRSDAAEPALRRWTRSIPAEMK